MTTAITERHVPLYLASPEDREAWLELRRTRLAASEIAAVLGLSPWESPFSLYWRKVNDWKVEETDHMRAGTLLEPAIVDWWGETHDPHENLHIGPSGLYAHPDRPWQLATPDRIIRTPCPECDGSGRADDCRCEDCFGWGYSGGPLAVLECKWLAHSWDGWGEPGTDDIPVHYRAQILWQCDVMGVDEWYLAALGPGGFRAYQGHRDETDLRVMRAAGRAFLDRLEAGDPPPVDGHTATLAVLKELHPSVHDGEAEISDATATLYRRAHALRARADALATRAEARLRAEMGDLRVAVHQGRKVASRSVYDTRRLDAARLRADHPEIAAEYTTTSTTDRLTPARSKP